jgi:hypothetical protein
MLLALFLAFSSLKFVDHLNLSCSDTANAWGSEPSGRGAGGGCAAGVAASRLVLSSPEVEEPDSLDPRAR